MENASKALIIAGAILLSILIIALGMRVYNSSSSVTDGAKLDAEEIRSHNAKFLAYEGKKNGTEVNSLLTIISNNNANFLDRQVSLGFSATTTERGLSNKISSTNAVITNSDIPGNGFDDLAATNGEITYSAGKLHAIQIRVKENSTYDISFKYSNIGLIMGCEIHIAKSN